MFGSHLSIAGGLHNALLEAQRLGCETVQIFTKSQKQWAAKPLEPAAIAEFRDLAQRLGLGKIVTHDSYLINLAAPDAAMWEKSIAAFIVEMQRCDELGIDYLVTHPGAHCGSGDDCGIQLVIDAMNRILTQQKNGRVTVCLETTAGQGTCLGWRFEQIAAMLEGIDDKKRVGVCVDTCHILAAGYDISTAEGTRKTLEQMHQTFGLGKLKVLHLNDSKKPLASRVDRHEHIARGFIGLPAFQVICTDPRFRSIPKILETAKEPAPDGIPWDVHNLKLLRELAAGERPRLRSLEKMAATPPARPLRKKAHT